RAGRAGARADGRPALRSPHARPHLRLVPPGERRHRRMAHHLPAAPAAASAGRWTTTVLDIGCGGGDVACALARWARRDGVDLRVTGIDPDPRAHDWARRRPPVAG